MMLIFGLMLMLKTAASVERFCWFNQAIPCYAALGDKLSVMMVVNTREYDLKIQKRTNSKDKDPVCKIKDDKIRKDECDLFNNRHDEVSVSNGILIINTVIRADSGNYRVEFNHSDGSLISADRQVIVEGVERFCWFNQSGPCYVALGVELSVMMMVNTREYDFKMHKINYNTQDDRLCKIKNDSIRKDECDLFNNRHDEVSVTNGILIINTVIRADSGNYRLEVFKSNGTVTSADLQVIVEDCVLRSESSSSAVHVLVWCFQMMVLLGLLGGFHIYMRLASGKKEEDQNV